MSPGAQCSGSTARHTDGVIQDVDTGKVRRSGEVPCVGRAIGFFSDHYHNWMAGFGLRTTETIKFLSSKSMGDAVNLE